MSQFSPPTEPSLEKEASSFQEGGLNQVTGGSKPTEGVACLGGRTWGCGVGFLHLRGSEQGQQQLRCLR